MIVKNKGKLMFCPEKTWGKLKHKNRINLPVIIPLLIVMGIFLLPQNAYPTEITAEKLIELTNQERNKAGLNNLTANQLLTAAALKKGEAIIESQNFSHNLDNKKFSYWIKEAGYNYSYVGENLAIDFASSEGVITAWNNSPTHKKNLLNEYYTEIGISVVEGNFNHQPTTLVVQIFGTPARTFQPQILGTDNTSEKLSAGQENYLTHAAAVSPEFSLEPTPNKLALWEASLPAASKLNKFFVQYKTLNILSSYLPSFFSFIIIIFLGYIYTFYFLRLYQLK